MVASLGGRGGVSNRAIWPTPWTDYLSVDSVSVYNKQGMECSAPSAVAIGIMVMTTTARRQLCGIGIGIGIGTGIGSQRASDWKSNSHPGLPLVRSDSIGSLATAQGWSRSRLFHDTVIHWTLCCESPLTLGRCLAMKQCSSCCLSDLHCCLFAMPGAGWTPAFLHRPCRRFPSFFCSYAPLLLLMRIIGS